MAAVTIRAAHATDAGDIAQLTTQLGYDLAEADAAARLWRVLVRDTNIKTQYSFSKPLNPAAAARVQTFVARVDPAGKSDEAREQQYDG